MAVERIKKLRALLIVTSRPETDRRWLGRTNVTALILNRLDERESAAVIERVVCNKPLSVSARRKIIEGTDGIPLFIEEMTKAALDEGGEDVDRRMLATTPASFTEVPASLHASLLARLDGLGPAKRVAQIGAVIGLYCFDKGGLRQGSLAGFAPKIHGLLNQTGFGVVMSQQLRPADGNVRGLAFNP
jgi:predicted ATPase